MHKIAVTSEELKTYRNGNSAKFFSYAGNSKYFKELSNLTLNGIVVFANLGSFTKV